MSFHHLDMRFKEEKQNQDGLMHITVCVNRQEQFARSCVWEQVKVKCVEKAFVAT